MKKETTRITTMRAGTAYLISLHTTNTVKVAICTILQYHEATNTAKLVKATTIFMKQRNLEVYMHTFAKEV